MPTNAPALHGKSLRVRLGWRSVLAGVVLVVVLAAIVLAVTVPFAGGGGRGSSLDNGSPTSIRRIERTTLTSQTPVSGTLGYEGSWTVSVPSTAAFGGTAVYTMLPAPGAVIRRGMRLYAIDGQPVLLLYGSTPAWRDLRLGVSPGRDVAELNANLRALGYGAPPGDSYTSATALAVSRLQRAHGLPQTGSVPLGSVAFEPGALRVTTVASTPGQAVVPGPVLTASSTREDVAVQLDAGQQSDVKVGDRVTVTLPDNSTTPGVVRSVGKVATVAPADESSGASGPTIAVEIRLLDEKAAGGLDQAPVDVSITTGRVANALVVPVESLVALAGGGYAVEEVEPDGTHRLVAVSVGLFDDASGLVQVSGSGLAPGQRIVVPAS